MKKKSLVGKGGEVRELTREDMQAIQLASEVLPIELLSILPKRKVGQRGVQKKPTKVAVTLRYSREVMDYFKATGAGWQVRVDDALKEWIKKHPRSA
jgi:uncharacterized protein (DUF4415 family)